MTIWRQGQFYPELGKTIVELAGHIAPGPSDDMISLLGFHIIPDRNGDYISGHKDEPYSFEEQDAIHTYAIIRMIIDIYENLLEHPVEWPWWGADSREPLLVDIRNADINARYIKEQRLIELDHYGPPNEQIYTCRSVDLIAHETAHVILDSLKPGWSNGVVETRGLVEAFCDLSSMFFVLSQIELCEVAMSENQGDLKTNSILSLFGVGYGFTNQPKKAIRSAVNNVFYQQGDWDCYNYSQLVIGILYEILTRIFNDNRNLHSNDVDALFHSGILWTKRTVNSFLACQYENSSIADFCLSLQNEFADYDLESLLKKRKII